jgi:hypothetical protein
VKTPTVRERFDPPAVEPSSPSVHSRPTQLIAMNGHEPSIYRRGDRSGCQRTARPLRAMIRSKTFKELDKRQVFEV